MAVTHYLINEVFRTRMRALALSPDAINCRRYSTRGALFHARRGGQFPGAECTQTTATPAPASKVKHNTTLTFLAHNQSACDML
jgi:hypothetical protein